MAAAHSHQKQHASIHSQLMKKIGSSKKRTRPALPSSAVDAAASANNNHLKRSVCLPKLEYLLFFSLSLSFFLSFVSSRLGIRFVLDFVSYTSLHLLTRVCCMPVQLHLPFPPPSTVLLLCSAEP